MDIKYLRSCFFTVIPVTDIGGGVGGGGGGGWGDATPFWHEIAPCAFLFMPVGHIATAQNLVTKPKQTIELYKHRAHVRAFAIGWKAASGSECDKTTARLSFKYRDLLHARSNVVIVVYFPKCNRHKADTYTISRGTAQFVAILSEQYSWIRYTSVKVHIGERSRMKTYYNIIRCQIITPLYK